MTEPIGTDTRGRPFVCVDEFHLLIGGMPRHGKNAAFYREARKALATGRQFSAANPKGWCCTAWPHCNCGKGQR